MENLSGMCLQFTDPAHLLLVKNWRDTAARKRIDSLKQSKLTHTWSYNIHNIVNYCL